MAVRIDAWRVALETETWKNLRFIVAEHSTDAL